MDFGYVDIGRINPKLLKIDINLNYPYKSNWIMDVELFCPPYSPPSILSCQNNSSSQKNTEEVLTQSHETRNTSNHQVSLSLNTEIETHEKAFQHPDYYDRSKPEHPRACPKLL